MLLIWGSVAVKIINGFNVHVLCGGKQTLWVPLRKNGHCTPLVYS